MVCVHAVISHQKYIIRSVHTSPICLLSKMATLVLLCGTTLNLVRSSASGGSSESEGGSILATRTRNRGVHTS